MLGAAGGFGRNAKPLFDDSIPILRTGAYDRDGIRVWDQEALEQH